MDIHLHVYRYKDVQLYRKIDTDANIRDADDNADIRIDINIVGHTCSIVIISRLVVLVTLRTHCRSLGLSSAGTMRTTKRP